MIQRNEIQPSIFERLGQRIKRQSQGNLRKKSDCSYEFSESNEMRIAANGSKIFQMNSEILFKKSPNSKQQISGLAKLLMEKKTTDIKNSLRNSLMTPLSEEKNIDYLQQQESQCVHCFCHSEEKNTLTEWDEEESTYVDTLQVKPRFQMQITPETQADEAEEYFEDFDFQLDGSCYGDNDNNKQSSNILDDEDYFSDFDF